jgi:hypothetical protein
VERVEHAADFTLDYLTPYSPESAISRIGLREQYEAS